MQELLEGNGAGTQPTLVPHHTLAKRGTGGICAFEQTSLFWEETKGNHDKSCYGKVDRKQADAIYSVPGR